MSAADVCRKHGVSEWSFYRWRQKYGGMNISEAKKPMHNNLNNQMVCAILI